MLSFRDNTILEGDGNFFVCFLFVVGCFCEKMVTCSLKLNFRIWKLLRN